jgi:cyclin C
MQSKSSSEYWTQHRFTWRSSNAYRDTDPYPIACTCLYLAAKVEETPHHLRTFVNEMSEQLRRKKHELDLLYTH